ncbi:amino acid adenylation domain-containing protein [Acanthopleuribacter pedis]|uniref:Amino acid adenylation domain-containing protein n=1 Tax=Acanthopleuribacter pedis TaxID=442870 RepID=A0A8J7QNG0_9BACT|nr:amino acid adenylation domain-containing protein [Acanthopleuribacter pedis]
MRNSFANNPVPRSCAIATSIETLIAAWAARGIRPVLVEGKLQIRGPKDALTPELIAEMKERKPDILAFLAVLQPPVAQDEPPPARDPDAPIPLTRGQKSLWFLDRFGDRGGAYHVPLGLHLRGPLNVEALHGALNALVRRHESLRTCFPAGADGEPRQHILEPADVLLVQRDLSDDPDPETLFEGHAAAEAALPFDLEQGPLVRFELCRLAPEHQVLLLTLHHIVADEAATRVFFEELVADYEQGCHGAKSRCDAPAYQIADFALWQAQQLRNQAWQNQRDYWARQLAGASLSCECPRDRGRPYATTPRADIFDFSFSPARLAALDRLAREFGTTRFTVALTLYATLIYRLSGQTDLVIATPFVNRPAPIWHKVLGFFTNTLLLRYDFDRNPRFSDLLTRAASTVIEAMEHGDLPFDEVVRLLGPTRDGGAVTTLGFVMQEQRDRRLQAAGLTFETMARGNRHAKEELCLYLSIGDDGIAGSFEFRADLFTEVSINRWIGWLGRLLDTFTAAPNQQVDAVALMSDEERETLLEEGQGSARAGLDNLCLHDLLAEVAARHASATALIDGEHKLSYRQLHQAADAWAVLLRTHGAGPEQIVALSVPRDHRALVAMLGILKAGAAFLNLDPDHPDERNAWMLDDAGVQILITDQNGAERGFAASRTCLRIEAPPVPGTRPLPPAKHHPEQAAYIIYTSGTTGRPKGVVVPHRAIVNFAVNAVNHYGMSLSDRVLQGGSLCFDLCMEELFPVWVCGGTLIMGEGVGRVDSATFLEFNRRHGITNWSMVSSQWQQLIADIDAGVAPMPPSLNVALVGGEAIDPASLAVWNRVTGGRALLINGYGPTETTVVSVYCLLRSQDGSMPGQPLPIGTPFDNERVYVVDRAGRLAPHGVAGELMIGGAGVTRGYLGNPAATAAVFVPDPFSDIPGARLYRTGDRVRWRNSGRLQYLGRLDRQVKIRGVRVELGEVESRLNGLPGVAAAVVLLRRETGREPLLVGYVAAAEADPPEPATLRAQLAALLPDAMVPRFVIVLPKLPATPTGKVDTRALSEIPLSTAPAKAAFQPPRSQVEQEVAAIWADLLGREQVGRDDNFFDLGGHSLLMLKLQARLRALGGDIALIDLFAATTVSAQAGLVSGVPAAVAEAQPEAMADPAASEDIAVIGFAFRFPGATSPEQFWANLIAGDVAVRRFSDAELLAAGEDPALLEDTNYVKARAVLEGDPGHFDAEFFGFNPREAARFDPQQRLLLETAWHALEHAGLNPAAAPGRVGVYAGASVNTYYHHCLAAAESGAADHFRDTLANLPDFLAAWIAYKLDLRGPAVNVQTACSTSLAAVHTACNALRVGDCDTALAGGVSLTVPGLRGYLYQEGMVHSPDGSCRPYDAEAAGTVGGDGVGLVVLKPLARALADGDTVHAVVKGSALNNDGAGRVGFTAPAVAGQAAVIRAALRKACVEPADIHYLEGHGTATPLGDRIELAAIKEVFGDSNERVLGALKANIGHLDAAAGIAGFIKTLLCVAHGRIPPHPAFNAPTDPASWDNQSPRINSEPIAWPDTHDGPRRAGVSSFGIGGNNVHVVLAQAPPQAQTPVANEPHLMLLSAKNPAALASLADAMAAFLERDKLPPFADIAHTTRVGRAALSYRRFAVCRTKAEARAFFKKIAAGEEAPQTEAAGTLVWLFSGELPEVFPDLPAMAKVLPLQPGTLAAVEAQLQHHLGLSLDDYRGKTRDRNGDNLAWLRDHVVWVAMQVVLARGFTALGLRPQTLIARGFGEWVAGCFTGALKLEHFLAQSAVWLQAAARGAPPQQMMVSMVRDDLLGLFAEQGLARLQIRNEGDEGRHLVVGSSEQLQQLRALSAERGFAPPEPTLSSLPAWEGDLAALDAAFPPATRSEPRLDGDCEWLSTRFPQSPVTAPDATFWRDLWSARHQDAAWFAALGDGDQLLFTDFSPTGGLLEIARQQCPRAVVATLLPPAGTPPDGALLGLLGRIWAQGILPNWSALPGPRRRVPLPLYPFAKTRCWVDPAPPQPERAAVGLYSRGMVAVEPIETARAGGRWLVFLDQGDRGGVTRWFETDAVPVLVFPGTHFIAQDPARFTINPGEPEHYHRLLAEVGHLPQRVLYAWNLHNPDGQAHQLFSLLAPLYLARALCRGNKPAHVDFLRRGLARVEPNEIIVPGASLMMGPLCVLPLEQPDLHLRCIDLPLNQPLAQTSPLPAAPPQNGVTPALVALRNHTWFGTCVQPVRPRAARRGFKRGGVYLITGGSRGIGFHLATHLISRWDARVILLSRDPEGVDPARRATLDEWTQTGLAELFAADVTDARALAAAVRQSRTRFGRIDGVIHAAGLPGGCDAGQLDAAEIRGDLAPKVAGTETLFQALRGLKLDFVLLCSSLSSFLGGAGHFSYTAANAYLDGVAAAGNHPWPVTAINWDSWQQLGMTAAVDNPGARIPPEAGVRVFEQAAAMDVPLLAVSVADLLTRIARRDTYLAAAGASPVGRPHTTRDSRSLEAELLRLWRDFFGGHPIAPSDNFFQIGGDSLAAVQLVQRMNSQLAMQLRVVDLFDRPTVRDLVTAQPDKVTPPPVAAAVPAPQPALVAAADTDIAVVGMACRFPHAPDTDTFWRRLKEGACSLQPVADLPPDLADDPSWVAVASVLEQADAFDPAFFGMTPGVAKNMSVQRRVFLETAFQALEHAGYDPARHPGAVGVYAGATPSREGGAEPTAAGEQVQQDFVATVVSYLLNLRGPSMDLYTHCSTSLVAVHNACRALQSGDCDMALAGGVCVEQGMRAGYRTQPAGIEARDGRVRAFDAEATGTVFGEGAGAVVLKRLSDALADGDTVHAVIKATALNNDGAQKASFMAPAVAGQAAVIQQCLQRAGLSPDQVDYVETHGTGTPIGDPIEFAALRRAFGDQPQQHCALGTVKNNIGHTIAAAGVAGLIKTVLCLKHRTLVPHIGFTRPNPRLELEGGAFTFCTELREGGGPTVAAVSAFGMGGTNAHALLTTAPGEPGNSGSHECHVLPLSAHTESAFGLAAERVAEFLEQPAAPALADIAFTLQVGRKPGAHRGFVVGRDRQSCVAALRAAGFLPRRQTTATNKATSASEAPPVIALFPGQGGAMAGLAGDLYRAEPRFRDVLDHCLERVRQALDVDLRPALIGEDSGPQVDTLLGQTLFAQPALFAFAYALAELWQSWGVRPNAFFGHSLGEWVAACRAGVMDLDDALRLVCCRASLMDETSPGAMAAVALSPPALQPYLEPDVVVAAYNAPQRQVISGPPEAVNALCTRLREDGVVVRPLAVNRAFHSPAMNGAAGKLAEALADIRLRPPGERFIANLTGDWVRPEAVVDPAYWADQVRRPVWFARGIETLQRDLPNAVWLELGPAPSLSRLVRASLPAEATLCDALPTRGENLREHLAATLGCLWVAGVPVDWTAYHAPHRRRRVPVPGSVMEPRSLGWGSRVRAPRPIPTPVPSVSTQQLAARVAPMVARLRAEHAATQSEYAVVLAALDQHCIAYLGAALSRLGMDLGLGQKLVPAAVAAQIGVTGQLREWLMMMLDSLVRTGYLRREDDQLVVVQSPPQSEPTAAELTAAVAGQDQLIPYRDLLHAAGPELDAILTGRRNAVELLFPEGNLAGMTGIYSDAEAADGIHALLGDLFAAFLAQSGKRSLNILEIGGGTGSAAAALLPFLAEHQAVAPCRYRFTDVSPYFLRRGRERWPDYPFIDYQTLDLNRDFGEQGLPAQHFDLIVAANVLHVADDLPDALRRVAALLTEDGLLLAQENTHRSIFSDVVFGSLKGWHAGGGTAAAPDNAAGWCSLLGDLGFRDLVSVPAPDQDDLGQAVLVAVAPKQRVPVQAATQPKPTQPGPGAAVSTPLAGTATETALQAIWETNLEVTLGSVADDFFALGGDSLVALQVAADIESALGVRLHGGDFNAAPTLQALAKLIDDKRAPAEPWIAADLPSEFIALTPDDGRKPLLVLVHPLFGWVDVFQTLAAGLAARYAVYGYESMVFNHPETPADIGALSTALCVGLRMLAPGRSWLLGGYSYGAAPALHAACRLDQEGAGPNRLVLLDAPHPSQLPANFGNPNAAFAEFFGITSLDESTADVLETAPQAWPAQLRQRAELLGHPLARLSEARIAACLQVYRTHCTALKAFQPPRYRGRALLLDAADHETRFFARQSEAWAPHFLGVTMRHTVPGNHFSMLNPPQVSALIELFRQLKD